ncbi:2-polyprenylphenol hydroxylase [hydrothermal vent metagenome]|uniref:2-polyprenylphenol hydroxylase n=1 Tax=hydrothermal vent metagenome TaxID=652676 RepID=A0A3B0VX62_9ZZZZ
MTEQYDIIINGAGMVGAVTALLLAEQGLTVALIESQPQTQYSKEDTHQLRVSAISKHNLELFEHLGLTEHWQTSRIGYYDQMRVWDNHSTGEVDFNSEGKQVLGAMIENNQIIATAQQLANGHNNIDVHYAMAIAEFDDAERKVYVTLENQAMLSCYLLLGADGAGSMIRRKLGIEIEQKPYKQHGLVGYLQIEKAPAKTALQSFNSGGPVGLLPVNDGLFSMVWSLPEDQVEHWLEADESYFIKGLKAHINRDFGAIELCSERQAFPLNKTYAKAFCKGRVALLGDAAHTIHPLAGQGVNLGFGDAECLVERISQVTLKNSDELANALKKYQRIRMAEVHKTAETMHALHLLFTNQTAPVKMLRAFGMNHLNKIKPIKQWLLRQAGS